MHAVSDNHLHSAVYSLYLQWLVGACFVHPAFLFTVTNKHIVLRVKTRRLLQSNTSLTSSPKKNLLTVLNSSAAYVGTENSL